MTLKQLEEAIAKALEEGATDETEICLSTRNNLEVAKRLSFISPVNSISLYGEPNRYYKPKKHKTAPLAPQFPKAIH